MKEKKIIVYNLQTNESLNDVIALDYQIYTTILNKIAFIRLCG